MEKNTSNAILSDKVGERIKQLLKQTNTTQEELASALFVNQASINKIVNGHRCPTVDQLVNLSKKFNVSIDYILLGADYNNSHYILTEQEEQVILNIAGCIKRQTQMA